MKQSVKFKNKNLNLAGNLFFPEKFDKNKKYVWSLMAKGVLYEA